MTEPTTQSTSSGAAELAALEQEVNSQAGQTETSDTKTTDATEQSGANAPEFGQAFQELASKKGFRTPDELARSYKALESQKTKMEQARSEMERQLEQLQSLKKSENVSDEQKQALKILEETIDRVVSKKMAPIQESLGVQKVDRMIVDLQGVHPEFKGAVVDETLDYMMDHPKVSMEDAFKIVSWDSVRSSSQQQQVKQKQKTEKSRAFVESASSSKSGSDIDYSKLSLEELEDILPASGDFQSYKGQVRRG